MPGKKGETFDNLMQSLMEVKAHREGRIELPTARVGIETPDVRAIRKRLKMSQERFAGLFGFSLSTVRAWEKGTRQPDVSTRHYLRVIDRNPQAVIEALR